MTPITNSTDYPTDRLRELIRFCCPSNVANFDVMVKNCRRCYHASAYTHGSSYHSRKAVRKGVKTIVSPWFIVLNLKLGHGWHDSHEFKARKAYLGMTLYNRTEVVLYLIAHELRHLWQRKIKRGYRVWGARGQYSERDADAYAIQIVRRWRREAPSEPRGSFPITPKAPKKAKRKRKPRLVIQAVAGCPGVNHGANGTWTIKMPARNPKLYYGLAAAHLNKAFKWGRPWTIAGHEEVA